MPLRIAVDLPSGWSRSGETFVKAGREHVGRLQMSPVELADGVGVVDGGVQLGRDAGWGTPLNLGEDECEHGKLVFVTFFGGPFTDARLWLVVGGDGSAVVFRWTSDDAALGDEAEVIVLRALGLLARPPSVFETRSRD